MEFKNLNSLNPLSCVSGKTQLINGFTGVHFAKHLKVFDISDSELRILFVLAKSDTFTKNSLLDYLYVDSICINEIIQSLHKKEYVSLSSENDIILATLKGKKFVDGIIPHWQKAMNEIHDLLGDEGRDALNLLVKIVSRNSTNN